MCRKEMVMVLFFTNGHLRYNNMQCAVFGTYTANSSFIMWLLCYMYTPLEETVEIEIITLDINSVTS